LSAIELKRSLHQVGYELSDIWQIFGRRNRTRIRNELKYELAALRVQLALVKHYYISQKAGFRFDQPRWPKGSGEDSGRWSGGVGTQAPNTGPVAPRPRGHHIVPGEIYRNEDLHPETRRVFEGETIGPLRAQAHNNGDGHREYNKAVQETFDRFKAERGIARSEDMTPNQARQFIDEIRGSADPRIRNFNMRIIMRELRFFIRRGRGGE